MNAQTLATETGARRHGRRTVVLLVFLAAVPFVGAWLFYLNPQWLPEPAAQHGDLIDPPQPLASLDLRDHAGRNVTVPERKWILLAVETEACADACLLRADALRRARRATGVERERVVRVQALAVEPAEDVAAELHRDAPDLHLAAVSPALRALAGKTPALLVADPRGNVMMRYDDTTPTTDIIKDLNRLLRISRSW